MSQAQNFRPLEEDLYIHIYTSQEHSGVVWVTHVFLERELNLPFGKMKYTFSLQDIHAFTLQLLAIAGCITFFFFFPAIWRGSILEQLTCSTDLNQQLSPSIHDGSTGLDAKFDSSLHYSPVQVFSGLQGIPFSIKLIDFSVWMTLQGSWYDASGWLAFRLQLFHIPVVKHSAIPQQPWQIHYLGCFNNFQGFYPLIFSFCFI